MKSRLLVLLMAVVMAPAFADPVFERCLLALKAQASAQGIPAADFDRYTAGLQPDSSVLPLLDAQPEFSTPIWDYLAALLDEQRIADGRNQLITHHDLLTRVGAQYGVDPATVVAVWGVESDYGRLFGKRPLLTSLATLSCSGRRQPFFRGELLALLKLVHSGDLAAQGLIGSWAGAFGHTQFMPSTYARIAVDGDGDGRRDLVGSIPDALASTANYLSRAGWRNGQAWGMEVKLPVGFNTAHSGRTKRRALRQWQALGVRAVDGSDLSPAGIDAAAAAALLLPAGNNGPALLVFRNYDAIYAYNAAESYALAIALLADRLRGGRGLVAAWPTDDPGLGRAERRELQQLLIVAGYDIGSADGMVGASTRRAIQAEQLHRGLQPADGRAGLRILTTLRGDGALLRRGTAFALPARYPEYLQSPAIPQTFSMPNIPGLTTGDFHGFPSLLVETAFSSAAISLFGGQLLSFVPRGAQDVLWLSPLAQRPPTPIRGGSPVCWPYFGKENQSGNVPSHGFVRTVPWTLVSAAQETDGSLTLTLAPPPFDDLPLRLTMVLRIGRGLEQSLITENAGTAPVRFTQALHNYFQVGDALKVDVQGLDGLDYLDKYEGYAQPHRQQGDWNLRDLRDPGRSDRIYTAAAGRYTLTDPVLGRRITITTEGSSTLVAWNPGEVAAAKMADVGAHWREYVCLEAANAGPDVIELAPGQRHTLKQTLSLEPLS